MAWREGSQVVQNAPGAQQFRRIWIPAVIGISIIACSAWVVRWTLTR